MVQNSTKKSVSGTRKVVFTGITILLPIFLLLLLESGLRIAGYGKDLNLFIRSETYPSYFEVNPDVANRFFSKMDGTGPSNDIFLADKPDTCFRIFIMGCSTTRGFPYEMGVAFTRILYFRLQDAFPHKRIEVINTAMAAVNSYTQVDFINEIIRQKPDAILIYTGHNEYYGALGVGSVENGGNIRWVKLLHLKLIKLRTYQLIQNIIYRISGTFSGDKGRPSGTLMERIVKDKEIEYGSETYLAGIEQFNINMREVVSRAKKANIPVILSDVVSNVKDLKPFKSVESARYPSAELVYGQAQDLEKKGQYDEARTAYYKAKDLDGIRFRAPEDLNKVIYGIGKGLNIPILGMQKVFEDHSPNRLIGDNLMIDHLHPNKDGYFLMADAFFNIMQEQKLISDTWDTSRIKSSEYYNRNWGYTTLDSLVAGLSIKKLKAGWPFQPESVVNNFKLSYKPDSFLDSIALMCIKYENVHIADKHIDLARYYALSGENIKAFNEIYSLIKTYPFYTQYYLQAAEYLYNAGDYENVRRLLLSVPYPRNDFLSLLNIGKMYQKIGDHSDAIVCFEHAKTVMKKEDNLEYLLTVLYKSYKETGNTGKLNDVLSEIKKKKINFNVEAASKKQEVLVTVDKEIKDYIEKAIALAKSNKLDESLEVLNQSLKIKESSFAYQMIGSIYFRKNDPRALQYLQKAYAMDPTDLSTLNNLFVIYVMKKDFKKAGICLNEIKSISKDTVQIQKLTGLLQKSIEAQK
jgi:tetratricopeptide (TPR) repeat protein